MSQDINAITPLQLAYFWTNVDRDTRAGGCWRWKGYVTVHGYGRFGSNDAVYQTHVLSYRLLLGDIPDGYVLDHLCHTADRTCPRGAACIHRRCVNPQHLEPVTASENSIRAAAPDVHRAATRTTCPHGHLLDEKNTYVRPSGFRDCRTCGRLRMRKRVARLRAEAA